MARGLKFRIEVVEGLNYPYSENKGVDQLRSVTAQLICIFVFAYTKIRFSHNKANFLMADLFAAISKVKSI